MKDNCELPVTNFQDLTSKLLSTPIHYYNVCMAVRCSYCNREYDVTLFEFDRSIVCVCGKTVKYNYELSITNYERTARKIEDRKIAEIRRMADRISSLIVSSDYPMIDIEIEKQKLQELISELFPDKTGLYDLIYEPRFKRLNEQFR